MTTPSVFSLPRFLHTADGMVVGPAWTDDHSRELLRALRMARPTAPDAYLSEFCSSGDDFAVAARIFHEVLSLHLDAAKWPIFAGSSGRHSLLKTSVLHCLDVAEASALCSLDESDMLLASNVARWLLQLPQQNSGTLVFVSAPSMLPPPVRRFRSATAREVVAVA